MSNICIKCGGLLWDNGCSPLTAVKRFCTCKVEPITVPTMYGWICPRCGKVHSPYSTVCDCPPATITKSSTNTNFTSNIK